MFPSGVWRGFWQQEGLGRQAMDAFELHFRAGRVAGHGRDIIGRFTFAGEYDERTGRVQMVKQYIGRHQVRYDGTPDGEGCILGTWTMTAKMGGEEWVGTGPFLLKPEIARPTGDEPIVEIKR